MDLLAACRAFVSVSDAGSFTLGAAAVRIPQSVASRRVAALEEELGSKLIDRTGRRATPTPVGNRLLPRARRLVQLADALYRDADAARSVPFRLAVPATCQHRAMAQLSAEGRAASVALDLRPADPVERLELLRVHDVEAALVVVAPDEAHWSVRLGLAGVRDTGERPVHIESLRSGRRAVAGTPRRIWLQPEDDVPTIRDRLVRLRDAVGLAPTQVTVAGTLTLAATEVLVSDDLLLCSRRQAAELHLNWRPLGDLALARSYALRAEADSEADRIATVLSSAIGRCLGSEAMPTGPADGPRGGLA